MACEAWQDALETAHRRPAHGVREKPRGRREQTDLSGPTKPASHATRAKAHHETVYLALRDDIVERRIGSGEKLLESSLARRFNVSRTPVREALHRLERDGLVTRTLNVGAIVAKNSSRTLRDHLETVMALESYAVEKWLAEGGPLKPGVKRLKALQAEMKAAYRDRDVDRYESANRLFHAFFIEQSGNTHLAEVIEATKRKMYDMAAESFPSAFHIEQYLADHDRLIAAIERRDAAEAVEMMRAHLRNVGSNLLGTVQIAQRLDDRAL